MDKDSFDPRTFFNLHDLNGDGFWNTDELEALFQVKFVTIFMNNLCDKMPEKCQKKMWCLDKSAALSVWKNLDCYDNLNK